MCGIIGYTGTKDAVPLLLEGLRKLEYRGYDSAGIAAFDHAGAEARIVRCQGKVARLAEALAAHPVAGRCGIGHTRWATHGRPSETNAHPHRQGKVSVVHNGIIENHLELRTELVASGRKFSSETDTEIVAHLIDVELASSGASLHAAVERALGRVRGTWALCVLHDDSPTEIVVARHGSPLLLGIGEVEEGAATKSTEMFVASDASAVIAYTRQVVDLEDGDTARIGPDAFEIHDASGKVVQRNSRRVDWSPVAAEKQGFKHFMLKEIHEQPRALADTLIGRISLERATVELDGMDLHATPIDKIYIIACGTSYHAGLVGKYMIERLARVPVEVELASEFRYRQPIVDERQLVIAISQSGETADTLSALREAKGLGATTLAICNVVGSSIARAADHALHTHAGPEISVASTKAFTTQLAILALIAVDFGQKRGQLDAEAIRKVLTGLSAVPEAVVQVLGQRSAIRAIARRYLDARSFLFLGRGLNYPVALEGALKLKEISYVHAQGYASGELKHGPLAMVDEHMPVVVLAPRGSAYEKVLANLEEVRARGGKIIAIATSGDERIGDLADDVIVVPDVDELCQPMVTTVPLQMLAYHLADLKGTDVDQPRNLAKSVTVE